VKKLRPLMNADKPPMAWRAPVDHENARSAAHLRMSIGFGRIHHFKDIHVFSEQRGLKMLVLSALIRVNLRPDSIFLSAS
jgi:hypothetical protein